MSNATLNYGNFYMKFAKQKRSERLRQSGVHEKSEATSPVNVNEIEDEEIKVSVNERNRKSCQETR